LGRQQLKWNQGNQEAHLVEDSQSRLREQPGAVERCSRSLYEDDDGKTQGGKSTAASGPEFQIVNNFRVGFEFGHVMCCSFFNLLLLKITLKNYLTSSQLWFSKWRVRGRTPQSGAHAHSRSPIGLSRLRVRGKTSQSKVHALSRCPIGLLKWRVRGKTPQLGAHALSRCPISLSRLRVRGRTSQSEVHALSRCPISLSS
jgi:hypothetical protein